MLRAFKLLIGLFNFFRLVSSLSRRTIMRAIFVLPDVVLRQIICVYVIIIVIDLVNEPRLIGHRKSVGVFILSIDK